MNTREREADSDLTLNTSRFGRPTDRLQPPKEKYLCLWEQAATGEADVRLPQSWELRMFPLLEGK